MKQLTMKRLETLEGKTTDQDEQVLKAIFFNVVDASKNAIEQQEQINSWIFPGNVIDRQPNETDESFSDRAAREAKKTIKDPFVVPCLFSN